MCHHGSIIAVGQHAAPGSSFGWCQAGGRQLHSDPVVFLRGCVTAQDVIAEHVQQISAGGRTKVQWTPAVQ